MTSTTATQRRKYSGIRRTRFPMSSIHSKSVVSCLIHRHLPNCPAKCRQQVPCGQSQLAMHCSTVMSPTPSNAKSAKKTRPSTVIAGSRTTTPARPQRTRPASPETSRAHPGGIRSATGPCASTEAMVARTMGRSDAASRTTCSMAMSMPSAGSAAGPPRRWPAGYARRLRGPKPVPPHTPRVPWMRNSDMSSPWTRPLSWRSDSIRDGFMAVLADQLSSCRQQPLRAPLSGAHPGCDGSSMSLRSRQSSFPCHSASSTSC